MTVAVDGAELHVYTVTVGRSSCRFTEGRLEGGGRAALKLHALNYVSMFRVYTDASVTSCLYFSSVLTHTHTHTCTGENCFKLQFFKLPPNLKKERKRMAERRIEDKK